MGIQTKLAKIQQSLKAPKDMNNSFGGYKYRSCESILEALKPCLSASVCTIKLSDDMVCIGERYYIKATATLTDTETGETESATAFAREPLTKKGMDDSQVTGAASSYARKYALNGLLAIDDNKDADTDEYQKPQREPVEICDACHNPILATGRFTAADIIRASLDKYGKKYCMDCAKKMRSQA